MFKKGDIIYHGWDKAYYIIENNGSTSSFIRGIHCLSVSQKKFELCKEYYSNIGRIQRLATPDEERWFKECVKRGKYIPFEEINQYYEIY